MTDVGQLKQRLQREGVPDAWYFIVGVDDPERSGPRDMGEIILDHSDDRSDWYSYSLERGERHNECHYGSEVDACQAVWEELSSALHQPVSPQSPEEQRRGVEDARRQVAEFEEWLRTRGASS